MTKRVSDNIWILESAFSKILKPHDSNIQMHEMLLVLNRSTTINEM